MLLNKAGFIISLSLFAANAAVAETAQCPESIALKDVVLEAPLKGWTQPQIAHKLFLSSIGVTDGPIEQMAELKPESTHTTKTGAHVIWRFANAYPAGLWLRCSYGGTTIKIGRQLPAGVKECSLKTVAEKSTVECK